MSPEAIDALVAAGVTVEQLAAAVKAEIKAAADQEEARRAEKRAGAAERQRRSRMSRVTPVTERDDCDASGPLPNDPPALTTTVENNLTLLPPLPPRRGAGRREFEREFVEEFWPAAWERVGKIPAQREYLGARKRGVPKEVILAGVAAHKAAGIPPQFMRKPAKWLKDGGWEDEHQPRTPNPANANRGGKNELIEAADELVIWTREQERIRDEEQQLLTFGGSGMYEEADWVLRQAGGG